MIQNPIKYLKRLLLAALFTGTAAFAQPAQKLNVVVILADDLGYSDLGCYGSEIPTPNIDALAANGVRFRNFHNMSRCCPTRASLLTGLYSHRAGVGHMGDDAGPNYPGYRGRLMPNAVTIPQILRQTANGGYRTIMINKWHLDNANTPPWTKGFDRGLTTNVGEFTLPLDGYKWYYTGISQDPGPNLGQLVRGKSITTGQEGLPAEWNSMYLGVTYAKKFIDEALTANKPFFLYYAGNAPHTPLHAPKPLIDAFDGKFSAGWDVLRQDRLQRMKAANLLPASATLSPRPAQIPAWSSLSAADKDRYETQMEIYAAMVTLYDNSVGFLVQHLKDQGVYDNTVILFMSDNGATAEYDVAGSLDLGPIATYFGGAASRIRPSSGWGMLSNTPFSRFKHFAYQGGVAAPLIVSGPSSLIPVGRKGKFSNIVCHMIDVLPTCLDLAGNAPYPLNFNGNTITPKAGINLMPSVVDSTLNARPAANEIVFFEHEGNAGARQFNWKLVRRNATPWELYNLDLDPAEANNVAGVAANQTRLTNMVNAWNNWASANNVLQWPGGTPPYTGTSLLPLINSTN
jgi:arylsulfatase A-like enzyme